MKLSYRSKRNPIAKDLRTSPQYKQKVVKDKTKYDRKTRNKFLEECKEIRTGAIDSMSREEVLDKLKEIGLDGKFKKEGNETVLSVEEKSDSEGLKDITPVQTKGSKGQNKV